MSDNKIFFHTRQSGVALLLTVVLVGAAALVMIVGATYLGINEADSGYGARRGEEARLFADGCIEDGLRRLRLDQSLTTLHLSTDGLSCIITISGAGSSRTLQVVATTTENYMAKADIQATLTGTVVTVQSWQDTSN